MALEITDDELRQLNPTDVQSYAVGLGWRQVLTKDSTIILLQHPTKELRQLLIPTNAIKNHNFALLYWAVRTLADDEQRPIRDVLNEFLLPPTVDVLLAAIRRHRDYRGDDRCYLNDGELYAVLPEGDTRPATDTAVTLENCQRFIARRQQGREYVSPEREIERLRAVIYRNPFSPWRNP